MLRKILLLCFAIIGATIAHAHDFFEVNDDDVVIYYNINPGEDNTVSVTYAGDRVSMSSGYWHYESINIPSEVEHDGVTYKVTEIGDQAFYYCSSLTSITLPETLLKIGESSFYMCSLTYIKIPASVTSIGRFAFDNNPLESIDLSKNSGLTNIRSYTFRNCENLVYVSLPKSVAVIEGYAFQNCSALSHIEWPSNLTEIQSNAFENTGFTDISDLPSSLKTIGDGAFMNCQNLGYVYIPYNITFIGGGAFAGSPVSLNLFSSDYVVEGGMLFNSAKDTLVCYVGKIGGEIVIPDGIESIEQNAFSYNQNITRLILPNSVRNANGFANNTTKLEFIQFPDSLENTSLSDFENNIALKEVVLPKNLKELRYLCFENCTSLEKIDLPEGLEYIEYRSLYNTAIKSLRIPSTVNKISYEAIVSPCLKLVYSDIVDVKNITYDYLESDDHYTIFGFIGGYPQPDLANATLVVPEGTIEEYEKQHNWNKFGVITDNSHSFSMSDDVILNTKKTVPVTVSMSNSTDIIGFQADIVLPQGVTIPLNDNNEPNITLTNRADKSHIVTAEKKGNTIKLMVISMKNASIKEHEGPLFTFDVEVTDESADGTIEINNIILAERGNTEHYLPPVWQTYPVRNYTPGDANDDGRITVGDVTCVIDYAVGREVEQFSASAADTNGDGKVTVGDVTMLIDMILNAEEQPEEESAVFMACAPSANAMETDTEYFSANTVDGKFGETATLDVNFTNETPIIAFQADIVLPAGVTIEKDEYGDPDITLSSRAADHFVTAREVSPNHYRMVAISLRNNEFKGNDGPLFSCPLKLDCTAGSYDITLKKLIVSIPGNTEIDCPNVMTQLNVADETTAVDTIPVNEVDNQDIYYNLQGLRVENPTAGVYIRVRGNLTEKVVIK